MKSLPMLAEDKEKFVNEITKTIGTNQQITTYYFRVIEGGTEETDATFVYLLMLLSMALPINKIYIRDAGINSSIEAIYGGISGDNVLKASIIHIPNIDVKIAIGDEEFIINTGENIKKTLNNICDIFMLGEEHQQLIANLVLQHFDSFKITEEEFYAYN